MTTHLRNIQVFVFCIYAVPYDYTCASDRRRRYRKQKTGAVEKKLLNAAPPSISNKNSSNRFDRKAYGERLKFQPVFNRKSMPKFKVDLNVFVDYDDSVNVVQDIKWQRDVNDYDEIDDRLIPSDVLNKHDFDIDVKPPKVEQNENDKIEEESISIRMVANSLEDDVGGHEEKNEEKECNVIQPSFVVIQS